MVNHKPIRFVEIISYEGTTIPPLEVFVYRKMTSISRILKTLVSQGLLEQTDSQGSNKYKISQSGREFLQAYYTFTNFADNFGLSI